MIGLGLALTAVVLLAGYAFYSGAEMGIYCVNRIRLRLRAEGPRARGPRALLELEQDRQGTVLALLLWQNTCAYLLTVAVSTWLGRAGHVHPARVDFYAALILAPIIFVLGDVTPKNWFQTEPDRLMYPSAGLLEASVNLLRRSGLLWLLQRTSRAAGRLIGADRAELWPGPRGEVLGLLREGMAGGVISEEQTRIVERVMNLSRVRLRAIMIPRRRVVSVPIDADRRAFEELVRQHPFSRLPVFGTDRKSIVGVVNVADALAEEGRFDLSRLMQPPLLLDSQESAAAALVQLQRAGATMAIVSEPWQGFVGIITLKDVVEEIFGELPAW